MSIVGVLPGEEPQLVVLSESPWSWGWQTELWLLPSGETRVIDHHRLGFTTDPSQPRPPDALFKTYDWRLLRDGRIATEAVQHFKSFWLAEDGEDLGSEIPDHLKVVFPETSLPIPSDLLQHYLPGDDPPDDYSGHAPYNLESISPSVIVQHGPFLRVINVGGDCLPLRVDPLPEAAELACVAERVLLQDQGDVVTDDGVTWREVRTPAGIEGWANGRYLE